LFQGESHEYASVPLYGPRSANRYERGGGSELQIAERNADSTLSEIDSENSTDRKALSCAIAHQLADAEGPTVTVAVAEGVASELEAELEAPALAEALDEALDESEADDPTEPDADAEGGGAEVVLPGTELLPGDWLLPGCVGATSLRSMRKS
jgi:hypothetical protein